MGRLSSEQVEQFKDQGYLIVEDLFDPHTDLDPIVAEYEGVLDRLATSLFESGAIRSTYSDLPFGQRLIKVYAEGGKDYTQHFDFTLPLKGVRHDTPIWLGPAIFSILTNARLLDAAESIVGPEIFSNPVQHIRLKTPDHLTPRDRATGRLLVPNASWHQDNGVVVPEADDTEILTVWFPLSDATVHNGCLQLVPRSHRDGVLQHCPTDGILQIPAKLFERDAAIPVPIKRGGALFMHRRMCHAALINHSDDIRWSMDLRFNPLGQPSGRGVLPGFVARSRSNPSSELHDPEAWAGMWHEARRKLAEREDPAYNRWSASAAACA
jgi:hypothetical protein